MLNLFAGSADSERMQLVSAVESAGARPGLRSMPIAGLAAAFFLSGVGSLALEVVWTRELRLVFGSTTLAASTILVAYMLGLGLGGLAGGRIASRLANGVRAYGWVEIAIGTYALAVPSLLGHFPELTRAWIGGLGFWPAALSRFALALTMLIVPTVLMGATLPMLVATVTRSDPRIGSRTGLLYGVNTLGAVIGVFLATFALFPTLGLWRTNLAGALTDVAVGAFAILVLAPHYERRADEVPATPRDHAKDADATERGRADGDASQRASDRDELHGRSVAPFLVAYGVIGFTALVYEVAWNRALSMVLGSSIHAFAAMLGAFLTGIGAGSLIVERRVDRMERPVAAVVRGLWALAGFALATTLVLPYLADVFTAAVAHLGLGAASIVTVQVGLSVMAMLPATLVLGALFPLVARIVARAMGDGGRAVGRVYFANTMGSASGAFAAGFLMIPALGIDGTLVLACALDLAAAGTLILCDRGRRKGVARPAALAFASAALLLAVPLPFDREALTRGPFKRPEDAIDFGIQLRALEGVRRPELVFYRDGLNSTVSVHRQPGVVYLKVNGKTDASTGIDMPTQVTIGHVPFLFGPPAKKVLIVGFASGVTVGSATRHPVERIDVVEIEPAMLEASRWFEPRNGTPRADARVRVIVDDGRSFLASTREKYDIIISEPSNPWISGVSNLFTREYFRAAREALAPGGRLAQWIQLYSLTPEAVASIVASLRAEFPYVYGLSTTGDGPDLILLASERPMGAADLPVWEALPAGVRRDLERTGNFSTADLWSLVRLLPSDTARFASRAPVENTDDDLYVELTAPRALYTDTLPANWAEIARARRAVLPLLEQLGVPLDRDAVGEIAFSYARARDDAAAADGIVGTALREGKTGNALATAVEVGRRLAGTDGFSAASQLAAADEAVALAPAAFAPRLVRGEVRLDASDPAGALADADAALVIRPDDPRARLLRWRALQRQGRLAEAAVEMRLVLESPMIEVEPTLRRGEIHLAAAAGRPADAAAMADRYLREEDPGWIEGWRLLAAQQDALGHAEDAARARRNAELAFENRSLSAVKRARVALWNGRTREAADLLGAVLAVDPENRLARSDLRALGAARDEGAAPAAR